ncbi:hypothetical protein HOY80DRAFT_1140495 [Tuber brumale]|nr:hypothetical protein HOY80DRAFT_1140495 [Tuber brumale]
MDINAYPANNTQLLRKFQWFKIPTDHGGIRAFALSKDEAEVMASVYTLIITFTFMLVLELVLELVMGFSKKFLDKDLKERLGIWESGSLNTARVMLEYLIQLVRYIVVGRKRGGPRESPPKWPAPPTSQLGAPSRDSQPQLQRRDDIVPGMEAEGEQQGDGVNTRSSVKREATVAKDLFLCALFAVLSIYLLAAEWAMGVIIAQRLVVGNIAPVNPDQVFYPDINNLIQQSDGSGLARLASLKMHSALGAIAASEGPGIIARRRVIIEKVDLHDGRTGNLSAGVNYTYNVTGVDMGLQSDPGLMFRVRGSCHTDYTWLANSTEEGDTYRLWGGNSTYHMKLEARSELPPHLTFFLDEKRILERSRNISYAIAVNTPGYYSYTPSQDPWYSTQKDRTNTTPPYQVLPGRPVLSCWETKAWHLDGKDVDSWRLNTLPGLKLHKLWADTVFPFEFEPPRIVSLGKAVGTSALKLASYAVDAPYFLDAGAASIYDDFERLVLGSWISSGNVLRDTTRYNHGSMANLARGPGGSVDDSAAKFVLESDDVGTISIGVAISVPSIFFCVSVIKLLKIWYTKRRDIH